MSSPGDDGADGPGPHPVDQRRPELRRRLGRADRGHPAQHRGDRAGGAARPAEGRGALAADRLRERPDRRQRRLHRVVLQGRARRAGAVRAGRRGVDPERDDQARGLLVRLRQQPRDRPADDHQRMARPARAQGARSSSRSAPAPPTAASTPWPATRPARWACPDYLGWSWKSKAGIPIVCVPGCPTHPDNLSETILYLLYQAAGTGADDPARRRAAADVAVRRHRARGLRPRRATTSRASSPPSTASRSAWSSSAAGARS